jgi:hypothetical protein
MVQLFDSFSVCPRPMLVVSGLLPWRKQFIAAARDSKTGNLSFPVCSPTGEAGKNVQTRLFLVIIAQRLFPDICGLPLLSLVGGNG